LLAPYLLLGAMLGEVGALYNRVSVGLLRFSDPLCGLLLSIGLRWWVPEWGLLFGLYLTWPEVAIR